MRWVAPGDKGYTWQLAMGVCSGVARSVMGVSLFSMLTPAYVEVMAWGRGGGSAGPQRGLTVGLKSTLKGIHLRVP